MAKTPAKKAAKPKVGSQEAIIEGLQSQICDANARITILEERQRVLVSAFRWIANEVRPIFGMSHLARVFDGVADRFDK